ncbi:thiol:disulfide interchange protein DsbA/DsbL [Lysobacter auxotrophicus]|uniref:Thiol:disulfide interchange protein DsbA/DsbL n=1 Tax=Lysobacter auxotrophicus TaxID=2992573 RepID=A0ABN6UPR2_9GAMM|nr:thiol:disulfide interchange protein DsbA/DsbL [Lysobacter auxotrophicus]BDU18321.1 thiol:disulfide interchange protein DsbA/DsbL [Lysobacter auxotrophicus]
MNSRLPHLAVVLTGLLVLSACSKQAPAPAETAAPAAPTAPAAPAETAPAPATTAAPADAAATPAAAPASAATPPQGPAPVAGTDYVEIAGGQPFEPTGGKIEVTEIFGYTCPHCAHFEPLVESWKAKQPADVKFVALAAPFGGYWEPYAKAFYTAQTMGVLDKTHQAVFNAIHVDRTLPVQPLPTNEQIAAFYGNYGVDPKQFASTMSSFAIDAKMKRAGQFIARSEVDSTPTMVINGKYKVTGKGFEDTLRIADHLIAQERAAKAGGAQ